MEISLKVFDKKDSMVGQLPGMVDCLDIRDNHQVGRAAVQHW
jgi:hypothetical protein